jgi:hypothetical protein
VIIVHPEWNLIFFAREDGTLSHITWTTKSSCHPYPCQSVW